jgi:hypothetical protein
MPNEDLPSRENLEPIGTLLAPERKPRGLDLNERRCCFDFLLETVVHSCSSSAKNFLNLEVQCGPPLPQR